MFTSESFIATPPGATVKEQLKDRGISQKEFAVRMGMSEKHISKLINGEVQLTPEVAERLEMVLGIPSRFWNKLEAIFREKLAKVRLQNEISQDLDIANQFPFVEMVRKGWLSEVSSSIERVIELRKFFEVANLGILLGNTCLSRIACRRQALTEKGNFALLAWAQRAKIEARSIPVKTINLDELRDKLPKLRRLTTLDPELFCPELKELLSECGIALVFLPHISGSFLHGASFRDGKKIVIGLTVRGKDSDKFWFSLFHELGHVLLGHVAQADGVTEEEENEADSFAKEILIPTPIFTAFIETKCFSEDSIRTFAKENEVLCGIVVGRMQKEGIIPFNRFNKLKTKYCLRSKNTLPPKDN